MFSSYLLITILFVATGSGGQETRYIPNAKHPDYPGKCYIFGQSLEVGEILKPINNTSCAMYTCEEDYLIVVNNCVRFTSNCKTLPRDYTKSFPDCCPRLLCKKPDGRTVIRPTTGNHYEIDVTNETDWS